MIKRYTQALLTFSIAVAAAQPAWAQDLPDWINRTRISGLVFGDAYAVAANHDEAVEGENGFWIRRVYLTLDNALSEQLAFRLRYEMNSPGDFTTNSKLEPAIKDLYVRWRNGQNDIYLGIAGTPIWGFIEGFWGYRDVEKTPLDLQKMGSSRDFGVAVRGRAGDDGAFRYHAQIGNGSGNKSETNKGKKLALSLGYHPPWGIHLEVYGDFEERPGDMDRSTYQAFAGWGGDKGRFGVMASRQHRQVDTGGSVDLNIVSIFGVIEFHERATLLARYDRMFDPNPSADGIAYVPMDPTAESNLILVGVDVTLDTRFHLIPNVESVFYSDATGPTTPGADVFGRMTFSLTF